MAPSATFCNIPLSTSVDPLSATSRVSLDWVLSAGIPTSRSVASGVLILPCSNTVCSMHTKLSVTSGLPYDLVLGRDWLFFCREMLPHSSFDLSSGTVTPGQPPAAPLGPSVPPGSNLGAMEVKAECSMDTSPQAPGRICVCEAPLACRCPSTSGSRPSDELMTPLTSLTLLRDILLGLTWTPCYKIPYFCIS
ncbi:hypothetical protein C8R44DRAFT_987707, partial [Mycena epipterygia]